MDSSNNGARVKPLTDAGTDSTVEDLPPSPYIGQGITINTVDKVVFDCLYGGLSGPKIKPEKPQLLLGQLRI